MTIKQPMRQDPAQGIALGRPKRESFKPDLKRWDPKHAATARKPGLTKAQQDYFAAAQRTDREPGAHDKFHKPPKIAVKIQAAKQTQKINKDPDRSLLARDDKNKMCKARPNKLHARRAGGGASKEWVPWCKK